ncbi:MAG: hypothetical protein QM779_13585 [Propionicimonas sp.]|uniref:nSTAND1 domain-containing NTPase n=1 Tax=Propionicimonas sp. TaxID=1955623 RepID=UPI003D10E63D
MPSAASRQEFAGLVNEARCRQHLSIRAVARIAEVPATTAQGWLNGKHFPTPALRGNYLKLLEHLGLTHAVPPDLWDDSWDGLVPLKSGTSPYLGLRAYRAGDRDLFFGRSGPTSRLATAVRDLGEGAGAGMVALVGASGSGKSSLLAAGLLGRELDGGLLAGWSGTSVEVIRLLAEPEPALGGEQGRRLVVIDQVEDALALPPEPRGRFLDAVAALATRAVVVLGVRSEAFASAASEPVLDEAMASPILLPAMTTEELAEVIVRPAEVLDVAVEDDLVRVLLEELAPTPGDRIAPGALPLLSNALLLIWAVSNGRRLTLADYHAAGGIASAVERLAEQVYLSLEPAQKAAAERMFLRLVRVTGDVPVRETLPLAEVDANTRVAMDAFVAARMLTTVDQEVRISHQALLVHWRRLGAWLAEHRDDLVVMERLRGAAGLWEASGRRDAALIPVKDLELFTDWLGRASRKQLLTDAEREFVAAADAHFAALADTARAEREQRRRWMIAAAVLGSLAAVLAVVVGILLLLAQTP